ncbi:MAG: UDP-N-acetylmuramate dehydrogenase [Acidobacteriota bacterium]|jgi:UDP-N-acetylmuramate dehydrogenase
MTDTPTPKAEAAAWSTASIAELEALCTAQGCQTARDEGLARYTSMGVGGPTPLMVWPQHPDAVATALEWCAARGLPWRVLGGGTNILVGDAGVAEPVFSLTALTDGAHIDAPVAVFPAGVTSAQALRATLRSGLRGLEWATGLPGTIGGAAAGNAGCWGGQMADVVHRLDVVDARGKWQTVEAFQLTWRYRSLRLPAALGEGTVIVAVAVNVASGDAEVLQSRCDELQEAKRRQQPIGARNAGCIFKNPDPDAPAGLLIDRAGCKGLRVGNAEVSTIHGNFLINHGGATAADVDALIARIKKAVHSTSGMTLEEEIKRW